MPTCPARLVPGWGFLEGKINMTDKKKYPERIYAVREGDTPLEEVVGGRWGREQAYLTGVGDGLLMRPQADPLAGCSLLNVSHPDWERIDWHQLLGVTAKLINAEVGVIIQTEVASAGPYTVGCDEGPHEVSAHKALILKSPPDMTCSALCGPTQSALGGKGDWSLWVEGEIPVKKRTADELEPGTSIRGHHYEHSHDDGELMTVVLSREGKFASYLLTADIVPASEIEVVEEYGLGILFNHEEEA